MKIVDVRVRRLDPKIVEPLPWRNGLPRKTRTLEPGFLELHTDEGLVGEAYVDDCPSVAKWVANGFKSEFVGQDPYRREYLWSRLWDLKRMEYFPVLGFGQVDIALWDLAAKAAGLPLYQYLGYARPTIPAYASTVTFDSVPEYLDVIDQCLELGYTAIKLHAWGDVVRDIELVGAVRGHVGDHIELMYDGSAAFDMPAAVRLGHALYDSGYLWYEEPMPEFSVSAYRALGQQVRVPLLLGEVSDGAHWNTGDFINTGVAGFVRTSSQFKGGITGAMRVAHLADAFQLRAEVHGAELPNAHLCLAISNTTYYESTVATNPVVPDLMLDGKANLIAPTGVGVGWSDYPERFHIETTPVEVQSC